MEFVDQALAARAIGDHETAKRLLGEAMEYERRAADAVAPGPDAEPTRSVLYRSAAWLAFDHGELPEAKRLIDMGLKGKPPAEIRDELRALRELIDTLPDDMAFEGSNEALTLLKARLKDTAP